MEAKTYAVPDHARAGSPNPITDLDRYREQWMRAEQDPDGFWLEEAKARVRWRKAPSEGCHGNFTTVKKEPITWFADGELNVTETCLDQHLEARGDKIAILWEGDEPGTNRTLTYKELHGEVNKAAHALRKLGVKKGERVIIYMGMVPEAAVAMLACARLGAVHSVVFGGFSASAVRDRVRDCGAETVITQDEGRRGGKTIALKSVVDAALEGEKSVDKVLVYKHTGAEVNWVEGRDHWWQDEVADQPDTLEPVVVKAEDPLFILYTSGSTGKPKGLLHTCGGYLTYASYTHETVFDLREDDVYACVADVGWVTGHTYIVYGPLANGATTMMFESIPSYPDVDRYWDVVERHKVNIFYTAPTALRAIACHGEEPVKKHDLSSLRVLGTVGEPIDPESWHWYFDVVGGQKCTIVDTWWQTETGGICISPIASATPIKAGSATFPMPGIVATLRDEKGHVLRGPAQGMLVLESPWPGQARTIWGDHDRFVSTYFSTFDDLYFAGDGARRDADGYLWVTGRVDDVLNVSGHRMGTAEFEAVMDGVEKVADAAVVGFPHELKGQGVYAYIVLQPGAAAGDVNEFELLKELNAACRVQIGAHAKLDKIQVVEGLPKTRSGKVMRRILRKIAEDKPDELGDVSTLADPSVVEAIKAGAK